MFTCYSSIIVAQENSFEQDQIIKDLISNAFEDIWSDFDTTKILDSHTEDFIILEQGEVWDNDRIKKYMKKSLSQNNKSKRNNSFEFININWSENRIWAAYHNYANWTIEDKIVGKAEWLESAVAIKTPKGWRLQMMHSTGVNK